MKPWIQTLLLGAGFGASFLLGHAWPGQLAAPGPLAAQGRGPVNPPASEGPTPPAADAGTNEPIVYAEDSGRGASANGFVAVTGSYGVGTSVLYLIDTVNRQLAVYEARGGSAEQRRVVLVGARRIDLDLQLEGYNDRSEYEYDDLQRLFRKGDRKDDEVRTGLEPGAPARKQ